ncbi:hypothetical protein EZV62_024108 [Acer yangbiense]|uniref:Zinc knuckle CX2CX4HX4C domain-containing protein n=1 Tax=Acer yangbiense TaxID=1000413 RepID=A0A5C7H3L7_9ROSI|nr:hypothetical protein EZV62_024108 [Acer yangbiense]
MGSEDIVNLCASLSVKEREGPVHTLRDGLKVGRAQKMVLCLAGKILSPDLVNREAFRAVISKIWRLRGGVEVEKVQLSNVPLLCMTKEIAEFLGNLIGEVREIETGTTGDCVGKFLQIRVAIETSKPLRRFLRVDVLGDGEETVMPIRYERLPNFYFRCGMLDHTVRCCKETIGRDCTAVSDLQYGAWLKVVGPTKAFEQRGWGSTSNDGRVGGFRRAGNLVNEARRFKQQAAVARSDPVAVGGAPMSQADPSKKQAGKFLGIGYADKGEVSGKDTVSPGSNMLRVGKQVSGSVPVGVENILKDSPAHENVRGSGRGDSGFLNSYIGRMDQMVENGCGLVTGPGSTHLLTHSDVVGPGECDSPNKENLMPSHPMGPIYVNKIIVEGQQLPSFVSGLIDSRLDTGVSTVVFSSQAVDTDKVRKGKRASGKRIVNWNKESRNVSIGRGEQISEVWCRKRKDVVVNDAFNDGSKRPRNDSSETLEQCWGMNSGPCGMAQMKEKMHRCAVKLDKWNQAKRRAMRAEISNLKKDLAKATKDVRLGSWKTVRDIERQLDFVLEKEEGYWKQQSRQDWLKGGTGTLNSSTKRPMLESDDLQFLELIARCLWVLKEKEMAILCVMFWRLWFKRNQFVHSATPACGDDVFEWAAGYVEDFHVANQNDDQSPRVSRPDRFLKWVPLSVGCFKINTDAALRVEDKIVGFGLVIRDSTGVVHAAAFP